MSLIFGDTSITNKEFERLRLLLSVYQDGIGMLSTDNHSLLFTNISQRKNFDKENHTNQAFEIHKISTKEKNATTLPGWRDFERAVALAFSGITFESKFIFDVVIPLDDKRYFGLSCKSKAELNKALKPNGRVTIEVSNAAGGFWEQLRNKGITESNFREPKQAVTMGETLIEMVENWHKSVDINNNGLIDISKSSYLILLYNAQASYKLYQFALKFPDPKTLDWAIPLKPFKGENKPPEYRKCLVAKDSFGETIIEWYYGSGGQLKYYPLAKNAYWASEVFHLEPLPIGTSHGVLKRVKEYFPKLWQEANE
ncbi:MAG: hypothetical protein WAQ98_18885 [Blastocatellia bacterium]